jgi:hypothetical protein
VPVKGIFKTAGFPETVARLLTGLCVNTTSTDIWDNDTVHATTGQVRQMRALYSRPHLPQGAPTSPALANLSAYRLDCRLASLANCAGASYTRYADDIAFSGQQIFDRVAKRIHFMPARLSWKRVSLSTITARCLSTTCRHGREPTLEHFAS